MKNKKTMLLTEDANLFKNMEGKYVSEEEKEFFERMKFKIEFEPAPANDLIMSNRNNDDGKVFPKGVVHVQRYQGANGSDARYMTSSEHKMLDAVISYFAPFAKLSPDN